MGTRYDPADHWAAWMGQYSVRRDDMAAMTFGQIVGMYEFAKGDDGG